MKTVTVNISFRKDLLESIDAAAKRESRTRSDLLREAARIYISGSIGKNDDISTKHETKSRTDEVEDGVAEKTIEIAADGITKNSYDKLIRLSDDITKQQIAEKAAKYDIQKKTYSYADYLTWPPEERWELIDGVPYDMSPAPSRRHQEISMALSVEFYTYLKGKPCKVYAAPFDVRLPKNCEAEDSEIKTVVQPDLVVVCNRERLDKRGCLKAPDLIVEILSPYTSSKDSVKKFNLYEREGVREYWVVRPDEQTVAVFRLDANNRYGRPDMYTAEDKIKVGIFDSLVIDLQDIFRE